jgi:hypothetical protein
VQIIPQSSASRLSWKILWLVLLSAYVGFVVRDYTAYRLAASHQRGALERAVALDPSDAGYHNRLGYYLMFSDQRPDLAIPQYRTAVALNSHIADYWLELASAYELTGAGEEQARALDQAYQVDPKTPEVSWEVANAFLMRGDEQKAFGMFRTALQSDLWRVRPTLQICWFATHDIDMVSEALPPVPTVYLEFLKLLVAERNTDAAERVWSQLIALKKPFDIPLAMPYLEYLITQHQIGYAQAAWNDLARTDPSFLSYLPSVSNLVVNGGFEAKPLNMGFDWRYEGRPHVTVALDSEQFHKDSRSLSISFDGEAVVDTGLSQFVALDPNSPYTFTAYVKTDAIFAAHGPQFVISDAYAQQSPLLLTEELLGTSSWRQIRGSFNTGPSTDLISLKIVRPLGAGRITGRLWVDDVVVVSE